MEDNNQPVVGIGACLDGKKVRYNGDSKKSNRHIEALRAHVDLRSFCPEVGIGMGVPRQTIRLVGSAAENVRLVDSSSQTIEYTQPMRDYAESVMRATPAMTGYIVVNGSPSCGFARVKRYNDKGNFVLSDSVGVFASAIKAIDPLLPLEEDGRLNDAALRENFVTRVFTYHDWKQFRSLPLTHHRLTGFWSRYKYMMMSHHMPTYTEIGRLLANATALPLSEIADKFALLLLNGLTHLTTRKTHSNVLQHLSGYLKTNLATDEKQEIHSLISQYRDGIIPLIVPVTMMRHHFKRHRYDYIDQQVYMQPYPDQLSLRNLI